MIFLRCVLLFFISILPITSQAWVVAHGENYHAGYNHIDVYGHDYGEGYYRSPARVAPGEAWYGTTHYIAPHCTAVKQCHDGNCITDENCY